MSVGDDELDSLLDKRVNVNFNDGTDFVHKQGTLLAVVPGKAILVKLAGQEKPTTIELKDLGIIELSRIDRSKKVTQRILVEPVEANVNSHLADKHNFLLSVINDVPPDMGMRLHGKIDHDDLGHKHDSI